MPRYLCSHIKRYNFFPARRLFTADADVHRKFLAGRKYPIYFIVKTRRLRFVPNKCRVGYGFDVHCTVTNGDAEFRGTANMADLWYAMDAMKMHFTSKEEMAAYLLARNPNWLFRRLPSAINYKLSSQIVSKDPSQTLTIHCALKRNMNKEGDAVTDLHAYQMANQYGWDCVDNLKVMYIGKSDAGTFDRLVNHEKWGRILTSLHEDEDVLVYFMEIDGDDYSIEARNGVSIIERSDAAIDFEDLVGITEMALISYFSPEMNEQHTKRDIGLTKLARKLGKTYDEFKIEVDLDGVMGRLGTASRTCGAHDESFVLPRKRPRDGRAPRP